MSTIRAQSRPEIHVDAFSDTLRWVHYANHSYHPYARRYSMYEWELYKPLIQDMYEKGLTRAQMLQNLDFSNFAPTISQLNARMAGWGFHVYGIKPSESHRILADVEKTSRSHTSPHFLQAEVDQGAQVDDIADWDPPSTRSRKVVLPYTRSKKEPSSIYLEQLSTAEPVIHPKVHYVPTTRPFDLGFRYSDGAVIFSEETYRCVLSLADLLYLAYRAREAFDLCFACFKHLAEVGNTAIQQAQVVVRCAMSAVTSPQRDCAASLIDALVPHIDTRGKNVKSFQALRRCLVDLRQSLSGEKIEWTTRIRRSAHSHPSIFYSVDLKSLSRKEDDDQHELVNMDSEIEMITRGLQDCTNCCRSIVELCHWCYESFESHRSERFGDLPQLQGGKLMYSSARSAEYNEMFQYVCSAFTNEYFHNPMLKTANFEMSCKNKVCSSKLNQSYMTCFIVMARLLLDPFCEESTLKTGVICWDRSRVIRAQIQRRNSSDRGIHLEALERLESYWICRAFVHTYLGHITFAYNTRATMPENWTAWTTDIISRISKMLIPRLATGSAVAAKPVSGSSRSAVRDHDLNPDPAELKAEQAAELVGACQDNTSSFLRFYKLSERAGAQRGQNRKANSDLMSIDSHSSWGFSHITGLPQDGLFSAEPHATMLD